MTSARVVADAMQLRVGRDSRDGVGRAEPCTGRDQHDPGDDEQDHATQRARAENERHRDGGRRDDESPEATVKMCPYSGSRPPSQDLLRSPQAFHGARPSTSGPGTRSPSALSRSPARARMGGRRRGHPPAVRGAARPPARVPPSSRGGRGRVGRRPSSKGAAPAPTRRRTRARRWDRGPRAPRRPAGSGTSRS